MSVSEASQPFQLVYEEPTAEELLEKWSPLPCHTHLPSLAESVPPTQTAPTPAASAAVRTAAFCALVWMETSVPPCSAQSAAASACSRAVATTESAANGG